MKLTTLLLNVLTANVLAKPLQLFVYWGQNSKYYVNPTPDRSTWEKPLGKYCEMDLGDVYYIAFLHIFPEYPGTGYPQINHAYHCETNFANKGQPGLLHCPEIAKDIKLCQSLGKKILMSLGGAAGLYSFSSNMVAEAFAIKFWNMFFEGKDSLRPYDDAVLDGVDLDIEGGPSTGYAAFVKKFKELASKGEKEYIVTSAHQCPIPDAYVGPGPNTALETEWFDDITPQFYNNYCGLQSYGTSNFNFNDWVNWAKTKSLNKNVKIGIGAPAHVKGVYSGGYLDVEKLKQISTDMYKQFPNYFGGVMLWDVGLSEVDGFGFKIRDHLRYLSGTPQPNPPQPNPPQPNPPQPNPPQPNPPQPSNKIISVCPKKPERWPRSGEKCNQTSYCYEDHLFECKSGVWQVYICENGLYCYKYGNDFGCTKL